MTSIQNDILDGLSSSTAMKGPCRVATTANIALTGLQTVDVVALAVNDRVLVKNQSAPSENGIWVVDTGPWRRSKDFNKTRDVRKGTRVTVTDGTANAGRDYIVTANNPISVGVTSLTIVEALSSDAGGSAAAAAISAASALSSQGAAATSASAASTSASAAATSASGASTSATNAATSASGAATSATNAGNSATAASGSASSASTSATNAGNSATAAAGSAVAAAASAASINLPAISAADAGKGVTVNAAGTGYDKNLLPIAVATRTAMKALTTAIDRPVLLTEAGRQGTFILKAGSPPVSDTQEGIYVVSNTASFYFERIYAPAVAPNIKAFGAVLDGSTNDSAAINGALAVCGMAIIPWTSTGFVAGDIDITPSLDHVIKSERRPVWKLPAAASCAIRVLPSAAAQSYAYIDKFTFDGSAAANTSGAIKINTSAGIVSGLRVASSIVKDCGFFYAEEVHASNYVVDMKFDDVLCFYTRGRQIDSRRSRGFFNWSDIKIDNTYNVAGGRPTVTWISVFFSDCLGLDFNAIDVVGQVPGSLAYQAGATAIYIDGSVGGRGSIYGRRLLADSATGPGIRLANLFNVEMDIVQSYGNLGTAIELNVVTKSTIGKAKAYGGVGLTNAAASAPGLAMISCVETTIDVLEAENNTGSGNTMVGCTDCTILGGYSKNNTAYGYFEDGTGDRNLRQGVRSRGNTAGDLSQAGTNSATLDWWGASGSYIARTVGPITGTNRANQVESIIATGSAVALTTATPANMTSISLEAGEWDIACQFEFKGGTTSTITYLVGSVSLVSATLDATNGRLVADYYGGAALFNNVPGAQVGMGVTTMRISLAATTTVYAVAQALFGVSTCSAFGTLRARRAG